MKKVLRLGCSVSHMLSFQKMIERNDFRQYARTFREMGLGAALCPIVKLKRREELQQAFADEDVMLTEVPAYHFNILDPNEEQRQKNIENLKIPNENSSVSDYVTISIGTCVITDYSDITMEKAIIFADKALYNAKDSGRNKVVISN